MSTADEATVLAVGVLFPLLGIAAVALRFLGRRRRGVELDTDDWLCIPALMLVVACGAVLIVGAAEHVVGYDLTTAAGQADEAETAGEAATTALLEKLGLAFDIMQTLALAAIEMSIIFLYRRLFPGRAFNLACALMGGIVVLRVLIFVISILIFSIRRLQQPGVSVAAFASENVFLDGLLIALSVEGVLINIALFMLPMPILIRVHMPPGKLLAAASTFFVAAVAISFGIIKIALPATAGYSNIDSSSPLDAITSILSGDNPSALGQYMLWGTVELGSLLVAVCLPAMGGLLERGNSGAHKRSPSTETDAEVEKARGLGIQVDSDEEQGRGASRLGLHDDGLNADLDPNYKFMESHVSMQFLSAGKKRGVSPAPDGAIVVENKITQTVETV